VGTALWELLSTRPDLTSCISIHHNESLEERELLEKMTGPLADYFRESGFDLSQIPATAGDVYVLLRKYLPHARILLIHNVVKGEQAWRSDPGYFYVLCPNSNQYIHRMMPDFQSFDELRGTVCLGTDSLASNHKLSILEEMKTVLNHSPETGFEKVLEWATINGARALGFDAEMGTLGQGKKPGLVNISLFDLEKGTLKPGSRAKRIL
jgi:cytosine/adenosine deaminase-related metal-dependent hydrolase